MLREVRLRFEKEEDGGAGVARTLHLAEHENPPELLVEQGFGYMLDWFYDEQPHAVQNGSRPNSQRAVSIHGVERSAGRLQLEGSATLSLPISWSMLSISNCRTPEKYPLVFSAALHTFVMRPAAPNPKVAARARAHRLSARQGLDHDGRQDSRSCTLAAQGRFSAPRSQGRAFRTEHSSHRQSRV